MTPESYEPDAVAAVRKWYAETGRSAYVCGPLLPPSSATAKAKEQQQSKQATEISAFLDTTLKTSGETMYVISKPSQLMGHADIRDP